MPSGFSLVAESDPAPKIDWEHILVRGLSQMVVEQPPALRDGNFEIYVIDSTGLNVTRLTNSPRIDRRPAWSPTG
ncbi:MAG: hypothetical protein V3S62_08670 [Acidimicrobiia bacterium]